MNNKYNIFLLCILLLSLFSFCGCKRNVNYLNAISVDAESNFVVRNWYILPQKNYSKVLIDSLNDSDYLIFKELCKTKSHLFTHQAADFLNLSEILKTGATASCYAYCYINSDEKRSVAFTMGIDNDAKIWVNDSLYLAQHASNITKNEFVFKANLEKGNNLVVVKISSDSDILGFHLNIVSLSTVNRYWYGKNFYSISKQYLITNNKTFDVIIQNSCYDTTMPVCIQILNSKKKVLIEKKFDKGKSWSIELSSLKSGAYQCKLITKDIQYEQAFIYGDYKPFLNDLKTGFKYLYIKPDIKLNVETLFSRFEYLDGFGRNNGYDQILERKMSGILYELDRIKNTLQENIYPFTNILGYHIMTYRSKIDGSINHYAVYIPDNLDSLSNIPTIMILPWVAKQNPFTESWHLAFIDRIEFLEHLAQKYKCAIMWQSARIYQKYNFNPIVNSAIFESFQDMQKYYKIDSNRIYAYGTCSGGTQTLLITNRHPSFFAAAGVEGPEISYLRSQYFPKLWVQQNNIITGSKNYSNLPLFIANSINDWHGGKEPETGNFINALKSIGESYEFESMGNPTVTQFIKMRDDNKITDQIFNFLIKKNRKIPFHIKFSTYQIKYNKSFWISIDSKTTDSLATIDAKLDSDKISLSTKNVKSFTIYPGEFPKNKFKKLNLYINNSHFHAINLDSSKSEYSFQIDIMEGEYQKNHFTEGPINDFFADRFYLVKRVDKLFSASIDSFSSNWKYNFFSSCYSKSEKNITNDELRNNSIFFFGNNSSNKYLKQMLDFLPLRICCDTITLFNKRWVGKNLTVKMIYPNPLNNKKYFLVIASTNNYINTNAIIDLPLKGWNDFEIINDASSVIYSGNFNQHWKLL